MRVENLLRFKSIKTRMVLRVSRIQLNMWNFIVTKFLFLLFILAELLRPLTFMSCFWRNLINLLKQIFSIQSSLPENFPVSNRCQEHASTKRHKDGCIEWMIHGQIQHSASRGCIFIKVLLFVVKFVVFIYTN